MGNGEPVVKRGFIDAGLDGHQRWRADWRKIFNGMFVSNVGSGNTLSGYADRLGAILGIPRPSVVRPHSQTETRQTHDFEYRIMLCNAMANWDLRGSPSAFKEYLAWWTWVNPIIEEAWVEGAWVWVVGERYVGTEPQTIVGGVFDIFTWIWNMHSGTPAERYFITQDHLKTHFPLHTSMGWGRTSSNQSGVAAPVNGLTGSSAEGYGLMSFDEGLDSFVIAPWQMVGYGSPGTFYWRPPTIDREQGHEAQEWFADWHTLLRHDIAHLFTIWGQWRDADSGSGPWSDWQDVDLNGNINGKQFVQLKIFVDIAGEEGWGQSEKQAVVDGFALVYACAKWLTPAEAIWLRPPE